MFQDIPEQIQQRMKVLEEIDNRDRTDGTDRMARLRQIPPDTGRFIALLAATAPPGQLVEIGTSAGYSTLWLALACREMGRTITTFEILDDKAEMALETFAKAEVTDVVKLIHGDALMHLPNMREIAFCFP